MMVLAVQVEGQAADQEVDPEDHPNQFPKAV
jgi:hypothetical protein